MQTSQDDLLKRLAELEATVRQMQRSRRDRRRVAGAAAVVALAGLTVFAQGSSGNIVRAPFRVVGAGGQTIFSVTEVSAGSGKLEMKGPGGKSFSAGLTDKGDAFGSWNGATGSAYIGAPPTKDFGVRISTAGGSNTVAAMTESSTSAFIGIGLHGVPKVAMEIDSKGSKLGVLNDTADKYLSNLTTHGSSGGDLELANSSGQIVAFMDANPNNNEGRAVFANAGGEALARIGAAGPHGDVVLSNPNKAIGVWEMALTGMLK
jgi:hypothetical protein